MTAQLPSPSKTEAYSLFEPKVIAFLKSSTPLEEWVRAFAYVEFLSDQGHRLSACYPPDALTLDEAQRVTKLALPSGDKVTKCAMERNSSFAFQIPSSSLYGFSHFVVAPRGNHVRDWTQNAVVILTPLQHFDFFTSLAGAISAKLTATEDRPEVIFSLVALTIALTWQSPPRLAPVCVRIRGPGINFESIVPATHAHALPEDGGDDQTLHAEGLMDNVQVHVRAAIGGDGGEDKERREAEVADQILQGGHEGSRLIEPHRVDEEFFSAEEEDDDIEHPCKAAVKPAIDSLEMQLCQNLASKGFSGSYASELAGRTKSEPLLIDPRFFGHSPEVSIYHSFKEILPCLLVVWETMITAEPFLIYGQDASRVSKAVLAAKSLIAPAVFVGDCRPLVDTYEPDFDVLANPAKFLSRYGSSAMEPRSPSSAMKSSPGISIRKVEGAVLGTTNPIVLSSLASTIPAILALAVPRTNIYIAPRVRAAQSFVIDRSAVSESASQPAADIRQATNAIQVLIHSLINKAGVGPHSNDYVYSDDAFEESTAATVTYLLTARKSAFSPKEHALFTRTYSRPDDKGTLDIRIRRALYELTEDFLRPFESYLTWDLRPLRLNPFQELSPPPVLDPHAFVSQCEPSGMFELISKNRLNRIYTLFIHTATYQEWMKKELAERKEAALRSQLAFCLSIGPEIVRRLTVYELERAQVTIE